VLERGEVLRGLAAGEPPAPFLLDGGAEAEFEDGVEGLVGGFEDLAEDAVEFVGGDRGEREAADEVDVLLLVDRERDGVQLPVAAQQFRPDLLVLLLGLAGDEGFDAEGVVFDDEPAGDVEFALPGEVDDDRAGGVGAVVGADRVERGLELFDHRSRVIAWERARRARR
jgi:hypothetical protein